MKTAQELNSLALRTRRMWNEDGYSPIDIFAIVNGWKEKKITLVRYPLSSRISGMCTREKQDVIICINSTTSYGRQRFTLAHELYHVLYEENMQRVICDMSMTGDKPESEYEADQFASYLLMPYDALLEYEYDQAKWTLEKVIDAEQFFQVSHYRFDGSGETGLRKGIILSDRKKSAIFYDWRIHSESGADDREGFYFKRKKGRTLDGSISGRYRVRF